MLSLSPRGSMQSSNATWPTAHMLPMCDGPMMTVSWWRSVGVTRASWSGPMSPRATGKSNSVTVRSRISRVRMMEVRDELFVHWMFLLLKRKSDIPVFHQVMTVMWRGRTRSTTPSRPYPLTCDPWRVWSPTCSWKSPLWTKGSLHLSYDIAEGIPASHCEKHKISASRWSQNCFPQSTFFFSCVKIPALSLPFWNNSAFFCSSSFL